MMFSLRFAVFVIFIWGINGQQNDNYKPSGNIEKGYPFGRLRLSEDGKKEELISGNPIEKIQLKQDQPQNVQPLPSPCVGTRPLTKLLYPGDKTKYIYCRDEFHYEIFSCPNNGEFNEQRAACDAVVPALDRCAEEKPCLNDGQCTILSNSTFKCTCRSDWTGARCETPINSCVKKPCGPNAECRILKTNDYDQDYVCVCHSKKGYGLNCQEVVPNPCLKGTEQYFPFAFSQRAYLQCDGESVYFQPCGSLLYWNQEEKICDRKRPPKLDIPTLVKKYGTTTVDDDDYDDEEQSTTTTTTTEAPLEEERFETNGRFVPAKAPSRQQGLFAQNQQQTQTVQSGFNQISQDSQPTSNQWSNRPWSHTPSKPQPQQQNQQVASQQWLNQVPTANTQNDQRFVPQTQSWQNQQQFRDQSEESTTTTTTTTTAPTTVAMTNSQSRNFQSWQNQPTNQWNNNQGVQSQPWQNVQGVGGQQPVFPTTSSPVNVPSWQHQPTNQWNNNQGGQSQPWQHVQGVGGQQPVFPTTPSTVGVPSWQNQWNNNQGVQSQPWQNVQGVGNQQPVFPTTPSSVNVPSWQHQPNNQWNTNQGAHSQPWQNVQGVGGQQPVFPTTPSPVNVPSWQHQPNNQWNTNQGGQSQSWQNVQGVGAQQPVFATTPSTVGVPSWQNQWNNNQGVQPQPWQQSRNMVTQQPILPTTTTTPSTVNASSSLQDQTQSEIETVTPSVETTTTTTTTQPSAVLAPNQYWQTKSSNEWNTNSNSPTIGFQPQQTVNNVRPLSQSWQNFQTISTQQPILPITTTTTTPQTNILQGNQWNNKPMSQTMGLTQQRGVLPIQKSFDQTPSWSQNNMNTQSMMDQHKTPDARFWNNHS